MRRVFTGIARVATAEPATRPGLAGDHLNEIWRTGRHVGRSPISVGFEAALRGLLGQHVPIRGSADDVARGVQRLR